MRPYGFIFISVMVAALFFIAVEPAMAAYSQLDSLTGLRQTFTVDNSFKTYSDEFRAEQTAPSVSESAITDKVKPKEQNWKYHRSLSYGGLYTRTSNRTEGDFDFIHSISPTVGMSKRSDYTYVALFYDLNLARHVQATESNTVNHAQRTILAYNFNKLKLTLTNAVRPSSAYATGTRTELQSDAGSNGKVSIYNNDFAINTEYIYSPKTSLSLVYTNSLYYFPVADGADDGSGNNAFSTLEHRVTPGITHAWTPKVNVYGKYTFGVDDYFQGGRFSSKTNEPVFGIRGKLNPKTSYAANVGYVFKDYEDRSVRDWSQVKWGAALHRKLTPKIDGTLSYTFDPQERLGAIGDQEFYADTQFLGVDTHWAVTPKIGLNSFAKVGWASQEGHLTKADFDNPAVSFTRPDETDIYTFGLSAAWAPRRFLNVSVAYDFTNTNASFKDAESEAHRLGGTVGLIF